MRQSGGFLSRSDLQAAEAEWFDPIKIRYRDVDVVTAPPPANTYGADGRPARVEGAADPRGGGTAAVASRR